MDSYRLISGAEKLLRCALIVGTVASLPLQSSASPTPTRAKRSNDLLRGIKHPLSLSHLQALQRQAPKLKPGSQKVLETLKLSEGSYADGVMGSGPTTDYCFSYYLGKGYGLTLVYDLTKKSPFFKRAEVHQAKRKP